MTGKITFLCCCCLLGGYFSRAQTPAIGHWRDHLPYHQAVAVTGAGSKVYCATPYSIFWVDNTDNSLHRMSKPEGLSETGVRAIGYDPQKDKLTIAYTNSNIDILTAGRVANIPDIYRTSLTGDKTINEVLVYNGFVYLSTNLGIIVLDEDKYEVKDTYVIGDNGDTLAVQSFATDGNFFYAATPLGLRKASAASADLADYHNWAVVNSGSYRQVAGLGSGVLGLRSDTVFVVADQGESIFYTGGGGWSINGLSVAEGKVLVCEQRADSGRVTILTGAGVVERILQQQGILQSPREAVLINGAAWAADSLGGLSAWGSSGNQAQSYIPNSALGLATGPMVLYTDPAAGAGAANVLWASAGGVDTNWAALHNRDGLFRWNGNEWTNYNSAGYFPGVYDFDAIAYNPRDSSIWAGSFGGGLLQWQPGDRFTVYASGSAVAAAQDDPSAYRVSGIAFDRNGNGWMANYGAAHELLLRRADGQWFSFAIPFSIPGNVVSQVLVDDYDQVWIVSPKGNGVVCYNPGAVLENASDDQWKYYRTGAGSGNLPDNRVYCVAKDKSGFIWIGTGNGIGLVQCTQQVFNASGCDAVWPIVQFDAFAGYLFGGQAVQAIAVDGADRKWVATRNGVWLISPDAQKVIYHFTADSTPLLSNDVRNITIDPRTGEVFFATASGLCSFRSTATEGGENNSDVLVFPNPVPPGYTGTIAIRGLVDGAVVKITEVSGRLVYQTNALGGQAVWDGRDYRGRKISTGVYLVLVSDESRHEQMATKIIFIGK